ncbi:MAG: ABC transporter ATP-binding protein [Planctomycetes bacterium]|nr:ABC transporter ATP-binding protein [Planctomycetota bacterium]
MNDGVVAESLRKSFGPGADALRGVSFAAGRGAITGLVGPDGAGKSTLLRLAAGLLLPDGGSVRVLGLDPDGEVHELRRRIGYMPQRFGLYEDLSVQENLRLFADLQGVVGDRRDEQFERLATMTGLAPFGDRLAGQLSGGMKQKLGLACALVKEPEFLLLDEPTVGVDPLSRRELWQIVDTLVDEHGIGVLVSTAYLDEAERCGDVVVLDRGEVLDIGPPARFAAAMRGRVFAVTPRPGVPPRRLQAALSGQPGVLDVSMRAGRVRAVAAADGEPIADLPALADDVAEVAATTPCFEDAFMARLAGRSERVQVRAPAVPERTAGGRVAVQVRDLRKHFGDFEAVRGVSFEVHEGEIFGLLGPNGAGKSTTFRMLCGLTSISDGEATVAGRDLRRAGKRARARLGYMAQKFSLYGSLSVLENLRFFGTAYGLAGARLRTRIDESLAEFGLGDRRRDTAATLPGGYKQRLAMAAALLHEPDILFLDEPTSGVDPVARREFWLRINAVALAGTTVVVTTHFMEEAEYCDRMLIMARGAELAIGTPAEIRATARSDEHPDPSIEDAFLILAERRTEAFA